MSEKTILAILVGLACPFLLPTVIEEKEESREE